MWGGSRVQSSGGYEAVGRIEVKVEDAARGIE